MSILLNEWQTTIMESTQHHQEDDENKLVISAVNDPQVFGRLYDLYFPRVYKYILFRVFDAQTADDLVSDVFERILSHLPHYTPAKAPFGAWVFGITRHVVNDHYRRQNRNRWLSLESLAKRSDPGDSPEGNHLERDQFDRLRKALNGLSNRENDLVSLKFSSGLTNRQIAALTGLNESNVGIILFRALGKLRLEMKKQEEQDE